MKKFVKLIICATVAACLITSCGKKPASNPRGGSSIPSGSNSGGVSREQQTVSNIRVHISDITAYAGEEIDYISAIQSAENMEIKRSMIYVDSSAVDNSTPGVYLAEYSFDYLGATVASSIKVTILANPNATTAAVEEETSTSSESVPEQPTDEASTNEPSAQEPAAEPADNNTGSQTADPSESESREQPEMPLSTEPVRATVEQELPDAVITLSNGKIVTVKCTSSRYIVETFTDETYFEEDGFTFLTSELKVLFNTGDIQVIETVVTRVDPQTSASPATSANTPQ